MARVVVDVMPKQEILDPQGKAVTGALARLGFDGLSVRQGKRFEIEVSGEVTDAVLAQIRSAAEKLLANTVIEDFTVYPDAPQQAAPTAPAAPGAANQQTPQQLAPAAPRAVPTRGTTPQPRPVQQQQPPRPTGGQQQ